METHIHSAFARILAVVLLTAAVSAPPVALAQTFKVLYAFTGGADGGNSNSGLVLDAVGNLYGSTYEGGDSGCFPGTCGVVFELTPGGWPTFTFVVKVGTAR